MSVRKVSFEVTDSWSIQGFRNFIKTLLSDEEAFEVFIISNDDSSSYILAAGNKLGLDNDHIIICNFTEDKLDAVRDNNIDIHLDSLYTFSELVDTETEAVGIYVSEMFNTQLLQPKYVVDFDVALAYLDSLEDEA